MRSVPFLSAAIRILAVAAILLGGLTYRPGIPSASADGDFHYSMLVTMHSCPQSVAAQTDPDQIRSICSTPLGGKSATVRFDPTAGGESDLSGSTDPNGNYQAPEVFEEGSYVVIISPPDDQPDFSVIALSVDDNSNFVQSPFVRTNPGTPAIGFTPSAAHEHIAIEFYFYDSNAVPADQTGFAPLLVGAFDCGSDIGGLQDANQMLQACQTPHPGIAVRVSGDNGVSASQNTNNSGGAQFNVAPGAYGVNVSVPDGFTSKIAACAEFDANNTRVTDNALYRPDPTQGINVQWTDPTHHVSCFFMFFTGGASINVFVWSCDLDAWSTSFAVWSQQCAGRIQGLTVVATNEDNGSAADSSTNENGVASFSGALGTFQIVAPIPVGFNNGIAGCAQLDAGGNLIAEPSMVPMEYVGGQAKVQITQAGNSANCWFLLYNTPDGVLNPPPPGVSGMALLCDANFSGVQPYSDTERAVLNDCPLVGSSIPLTLTLPDGTNQAITTEADGTYIFPSLSQGTYQLHADGPAGNDGLTAFCFNLSAESPGMSGLADTATRGTVAITIDQDNQILRCRLLLYNPDGPQPNLGTAKAEGNSTFIFNVLSCGFRNAWESTGDVRNQFCTQPVEGQVIKVTRPDAKTVNVTTDNKGTVSMAADPGDYKFNVAVLKQFNDAMMSCSALDANGDPMPGGGDFPIGATAGQGAATISQPGDTVTCIFYVYRSLDGELNPPAKGLSGQVLLCETNLSITGASSDSERAQFNDCSVATESVTLTLTKPDGTTLDATTDENGNYSFGALPVGVYGLKTNAPAPHTGLLASCNDLDPNFVGFAGWIPDTTTTGTINIEIKLETTQMACRLLLYNPDGGKPNTQIAVKAPADDNTGEGNNADDANDDDQGDTTTNNGGTTPPDNGSGGTTTNGGGGTSTNGGGTNQSTNTGDGTGSIALSVFNCPNGFMSSNIKQMQATCKPADQPVVFTLTGASNQSQATGDPSADAVTFDGLKSGLWVVAVALPEGFGLARVFCEDSTGTLQSVPVIRDNSTRIRLKNGQEQKCSWFNVTEQPSQLAGGEPTATLVLTLRTCPAGYSPDDADADPEQDCTELTDNINISATDADGVRARRQTGETDPGVSTYDGLVSGTYRLHQGYPKGVHASFILKCTSDTRDLSSIFTPLTSIDESGSVKITLEAPETLSCAWYNIPDESEDDSNGNGTLVLQDRAIIRPVVRLSGNRFIAA